MKKLLAFALLLACIVVPLGAYVRLSEAGLGCPDWPGCFGQLSPHHAAGEIARAEVLAPDGPVTHGKAWREMVHRYLAAALGLLILLNAVRALRAGKGQGPALLLLGWVVLQGVFGMLTVTLQLEPLIVTGHLLLGFGLTVLLLLRLTRHRRIKVAAPEGLRWLSSLLVCAVLGQIVLGGWVSAHHAGLACQGFPTCNGSWVPPDLDPPAAFSFGHGATDLSGPVLVTIQWMHRLGAVLVSLMVAAVALAASGLPALKGSVRLLAGAWLLQVGLGIANVLLQLPLSLAVAHNAGALCLLASACLLRARLAEPAGSPAWLSSMSGSR